MSKRELSASAKQILEKRNRKFLMFELAKMITKEEIREALKNPNFQTKTEEEIADYIIKLKGIPILPFIREFINYEPEKTSVKIETAKEYFNEFAYSLKPKFVIAEKHRFHLRKVLVKELVREVREGMKKVRINEKFIEKTV